ncbi:hypothetical protein EVAR_94708_1 [Eumeta japonica]|uniref:Uncharacterized protein n=1 Tax=Eumeta variegata TaxID=151549 RepID=A0A4C1UVR4_EUMVA|nr:hypothetical protein EVAR_94708_1 [Eumeta japonica]
MVRFTLSSNVDVAYSVLLEQKCGDSSAGAAPRRKSSTSGVSNYSSPYTLHARIRLPLVVFRTKGATARIVNSKQAASRQRRGINFNRSLTEGLGRCVLMRDSQRAPRGIFRRLYVTKVRQFAPRLSDFKGAARRAAGLKGLSGLAHLLTSHRGLKRGINICVVENV